MMQLSIASAFKNDFHFKGRYLIECGGAGSGKSYFAASKLIHRALSEVTKSFVHRFLVVRKVNRTLHGSCIQLVLDILKAGEIAHEYSVSKQAIRLYNGADIHFTGLDDAEKIKSIQGITGIWKEEATELSASDADQLDLRLRGEFPFYKQIIDTFNPIEGDAAWLKERYFNPDGNPKRVDGAMVHVTTVENNPFIDREYINTLDALNDDTYKAIYRHGKWAIRKGVIYSNWKSFNDSPVNAESVCYGLDFGFNNPSALVKVSTIDGVAYVEELLYQSKLTNTDLIAMLGSVGVDKNAPLYCDCAEPARISEIISAGYMALPADKSVKDGIDYCKASPFFVHENSVNLIAELKGYKYKADKDGKPMPEEPVKFKDHACDAMRYARYTHYKHGQSAGGVMFI